MRYKILLRLWTLMCTSLGFVWLRLYTFLSETLRQETQIQGIPLERATTFTAHRDSILARLSLSNFGPAFKKVNDTVNGTRIFSIIRSRVLTMLSRESLVISAAAKIARRQTNNEQHQQYIIVL